MYTDSHCHLHFLDLNELNTSLGDIVAAAREAKVNNMLCVATHPDQHPILMKIAEQFNDIKISYGLHPNDDVMASFDPESAISFASNSYVVAIGETGLDYYRALDAKEKKRQQATFIAQINLANQLAKPLIVHTRQAKEDTLNILKNERAHAGVLHCFTEDFDMAKKAIDLGFYISISGIITFKNATELRETVTQLPLDALLIETDSPYLAPVPYRGAINLPQYVPKVAEQIAQLKKVSLIEVATATTNNYLRFIGEDSMMNDY